MPQVKVLISGGGKLDLNAPVFTALQKAISDAQQYLEEPEIVESTPVLCDAPEDPAVSVLELQKKIFVLEAEIEERRRATDQVLTVLKPFGITEEETAPPQTTLEPVETVPHLIPEGTDLEQLIDGVTYVTCEWLSSPHPYSAWLCDMPKAA